MSTLCILDFYGIPVVSFIFVIIHIGLPLGAAILNEGEKEIYSFHPKPLRKTLPQRLKYI